MDHTIEFDIEGLFDDAVLKFQQTFANQHMRSLVADETIDGRCCRIVRTIL